MDGNRPSSLPMRALRVLVREGPQGFARKARGYIASRSEHRQDAGVEACAAEASRTSPTESTMTVTDADEARRKALGDTHIGGRGLEIGAGLRPGLYANIRELAFVDKRTPGELEALFKARISYPVLSLREAFHRARSDPADFVVAHHVLEHCANPVLTMMDWLSLLRPAGRLFVSVPAHDNACERSRLPTPIEHLLDDYLYQRDGSDYESKDHIPSFIVQWTALSPENFWYAKGSVKEFAVTVLSELGRDGHDLHWHTFTPKVLREVIEAACWFAGVEPRWLWHEHSGGAIYAIVSKEVCTDTRHRSVPDVISRHRARLESALVRLVGPAGEGK